MADTIQFIKGIKPQLREKLIYREYLNQKYKQKKAQGWGKVQKEIKAAHSEYLLLLQFFSPETARKEQLDKSWR